MSNAVMFITFRLAKGVSAQEFLLMSEKLNTEFMSRQKGFISWKQLVEGDTWADIVTWETMEDAKNAEAASGTNALSEEFCALLDPESIKAHLFTVEKEYLAIR